MGLLDSPRACPSSSELLKDASTAGLHLCPQATHAPSCSPAHLLNSPQVFSKNHGVKTEHDIHEVTFLSPSGPQPTWSPHCALAWSLGWEVHVSFP